MDSGNSGSLQSSSGGDDEYDSRSESISAFLNSSTHMGALTNPRQQSQLPPSSSSHHHHHHHHHHPTSLFDPLSNYFDVFSRSTPPPNPNSPLNLDMVWSRTLRSEPNSTDMGALMGSSSSSQALMGTHHQDVNVVPIHNSSSSSLPHGVDTSVRPSASSSDQTNVARQSKKRSRASRRAPTTVLTTDTSNFRAMVQEFTGIPAPPFSASPFPRSRLDLFNTSSTMRSGHLEATRPPPYLLRPFAQKIQPPPFTSSGSASNTNSTTNNMNTTSNSTCSNNYQLLSELGLSKQSQNLGNMQNPVLTFQSLLQSTIPQKYTLPNPSGFGQNTQGLLSSTRMGALDEFNVNHGQVRAHLNELLPTFLTSEGMLLRTDNIRGDGVGSNEREQEHLRSFNENYGNSSQPQRINSCKMNFSTGGSSSHDKGGSDQNVTTTTTTTSRGGEGFASQRLLFMKETY